jgi:CRP-like cAMP-binding protein
MNPDLVLYDSRIKQFVATLDIAALEALEGITETETYPKGSLLLKAGHVCRNSFEIVTGIARKYHLHNGAETTNEIYFEHDLALSFASYALQRPSEEFIEALTDVTARVINYDSFQKAKEQYPMLRQLDLMLLEYYGIWVEDRMNQMRRYTATERYKLLLEHTPHIVKSVPLTYIASYLGISLETLSRIRSRR